MIALTVKPTRPAFKQFARPFAKFARGRVPAWITDADELPEGVEPGGTPPPYDPPVVLSPEVLGAILASVATVAVDRCGWSDEVVEPRPPLVTGTASDRPIVSEYADDHWHRSITLCSPRAWRAIPTAIRPDDAEPVGDDGWYVVIRNVRPTASNREVLEKCERLGTIRIDRADWSYRRLDPTERDEASREELRREIAATMIRQEALSA